MREVAALTHETGDDSVKAAALETKAAITSTQRAEVLCSLWYDIGVELNYQNSPIVNSIYKVGKSKNIYNSFFYNSLIEINLIHYALNNVLI